MWLDHLRQDIRDGIRSLGRYPIAALVAVVSLAGGIGATTATLIVRDVVFHRPPALYQAPEQLSTVQVGSPDRPIRPLGNPVPGRLFALWRDANLGATLAASTDARTRDVRTTDREETVRVRAVTPELFSLLGVNPAQGRTFSPSDTQSAVLSDRLWRQLFDGRPDVAGQVVWIENQPHVVIGVMPERFWFSSMDSPIWTLLDDRAAVGESTVEVIVRRAAGVSPELLAQQLQQGLDEYTKGLPSAERQLYLKVSPVEGTPVGKSVALVLPWLLGSAVLLTLLIACANVAILVIAQWTAREQEIAIRASLGASRGRIVRSLLTESALIAAAGGLLGTCAAEALRGLIAHNAGGGTYALFFDLSLDPRVLIESALITLLTGVVSGVGPALVETRRLHGNPMRSMASSDRVRQQWRHTLVVAEIAVTIALLVVTATMLDGYRRNFTIDVGYNTKPLVAMRVENARGIPTARIVEILRGMPGVVSAAASTTVPYAGSGPLQRVAADAAGSNAVRAEQGTIDADFFATLDVPIRAGRGFTAVDSADTRTAVVNETLARRLFGGASPIGRRVWMRETAHEIVGVVADYANAAFQNHDRDPKLYLPLGAGRTDIKRMQFLIRAPSDPAAIARTLRREIQGAVPGNVVASAYTLDQIIAVSGQEILVGTAPLVPLIATGMLLTAAGIYGVLAFAITRRSKELAVRVAVGASGRDLLVLVTSHSLRLVAVGTGMGVGITYALARIMRATGGGGSVFDPSWPAFVVPMLIVFGIGSLATWIPSRRALRIDPAILLRTT